MAKKKKDNEAKAKAAAIHPDDVLDQTGLVIAFLRLDLEDGEVNFHWLPTLFSRPIPPGLKKDIVEKLRFHANKLECGDMEQAMERFTRMNHEPKTDQVQ